VNLPFDSRTARQIVEMLASDPVLLWLGVAGLCLAIAVILNARRRARDDEARHRNDGRGMFD
jgi:hypothetical protein